MKLHCAWIKQQQRMVEEKCKHCCQTKIFDEEKKWRKEVQNEKVFGMEKMDSWQGEQPQVKYFSRTDKMI